MITRAIWVFSVTLLSFLFPYGGVLYIDRHYAPIETFLPDPAQAERTRLVEQGSCNLPVAWYVSLNTEQQQWLDSINNRDQCNPYNLCNASCITEGRDRQTQGGCTIIYWDTLLKPKE